MTDEEVLWTPHKGSSRVRSAKAPAQVDSIALKADRSDKALPVNKESTYNSPLQRKIDHEGTFKAETPNGSWSSHSTPSHSRIPTAGSSTEKLESTTLPVLRRSPRLLLQRGEASEGTTHEHELLAQLLFPPSPPEPISSNRTNHPSRKLTLEVISDSEAEETNIRPSKGEGLSRLNDRGKEVLHTEVRRFQVYTLDDSSDEELGLSGLSTSEIINITPKPSREESPRAIRSARRQRRVTISVISDDDADEQGDSSNTELVINDDEEQESLDRIEHSQALKENDGAEPGFDPEAGVLFYEPPKSAPRPKKLRSQPGSTSMSNSNSGLDEPEATPSSVRKIAEIDLTISSDEDDELPSPKFRFYTPSKKSTPRTIKAVPQPPKSMKTKRPALSVNLLTAEERERLPFELVQELQKSIFGRDYSSTSHLMRGSNSSLAQGLPNDIEIIWNKKLLKTAGRASWKRSNTGSMKERSIIELSTKVVDTRKKLNNTLSHELCHLAAWIISREMKPPHGDAFKLWAARIMKCRPDIEITTTHSYEISYKYQWKCSSLLCQKSFQRHSRSIDTTTHGCPCGSRLLEIDKDGNEKRANASDPKTPVKRSAWQEYLSVMSPQIRRENPEIRQEDVFKLVAAKWRAEKENAASHLEAGMHGLQIT